MALTFVLASFNLSTSADLCFLVLIVSQDNQAQILGELRLQRKDSMTLDSSLLWRLSYSCEMASRYCYILGKMNHLTL
jgi:hypothetical protein